MSETNQTTTSEANRAADAEVTEAIKRVERIVNSVARQVAGTWGLSSHDAQDFAQEIFIAVIRAYRANPPHPDALTSWSRTIAYRTANNLASEKASNEIRFSELVSEEVAEEYGDLDPEDCSRASVSVSAALREVIDSLPPRPRRLALALFDNPTNIRAAVEIAGIGRTQAYVYLDVIRRALTEAGFNPPFSDRTV
jgi:RNA polymerase sigma factor (sigma-70 family)